MPRFLQEPEFTHGSTPRTGVLLINLGTPAAPTAKAVRPYLKQFLSDPRVVEIPRALWWLILNGIILNTRPKKSAAKYATVWSKEGSPLRVHTEKQAKLLAGYLLQAGHPDVQVDWAMRYGQPDVEGALMRLKARGCSRILVLPLYPQYAASTTASAFDAVAAAGMKIRNLPELRFVRSFHDHPDYIRALGQRIAAHWQQHGMPDKLVMSFHGTPRFSLDKGDPYHCECHKTARLLAEYLSLKPEQYLVTFQSRFGRAEWLQPYTEPSLQKLAKEGVKSVDVVCPGFVSDCLETLEEIALECKAAFLNAGGKEFRYVPCLNEEPDFIGALRNIARSHMQDWLATPAPSPTTLAASKACAHALGATQ
ncbi:MULTISPECIES: ferrochelatase [unclassified Uliginosibacterium]|uniref:ferrochelatase n=1 Tax=unclassified Uliginosibacterium TaxID=2621521 RepID=UPI000C7A0279|nr:MULTISPECIES: ferrochelatase [unclassified Uliginosibacterium]MDO6384873.1 ferrochelatase [Uliginosibacterium sp. 31-12]PLK48553.1 ferrochelatase [Uliginosibacterium sp. TH139]